jgi:solute carrier family 25 (mitochondrial carnitine/acylcarnitine transporter), member 20/29
MTHNEKRTVWWKEALFGGLAGLNYGIIQVTFGHPFDTIKTKMQVQEEFKNLSFSKSVKKVYASDGIRGFYRGGLSIILGSSLFRSFQFSGFEAVHSRFEKTNLKQKSYEKFFTYTIPYTKGLEVRTIAAGIVSGISRTLAECPFEYVKVRKQVKTNFSLLNIYHGLLPLMTKNALMVSIGFCFIDTFRRNTNAWKSSLGIFLATGASTIICHILVWPIEIFRNFYMSRNKSEIKGNSFRSVVNNNIKLYGYLGGMFRGALPGLISTFLRNGMAMVLLQKIQKLITHLGLRG